MFGSGITTIINVNFSWPSRPNLRNGRPPDAVNQMVCGTIAGSQLRDAVPIPLPPELSRDCARNLQTPYQEFARAGLVEVPHHAVNRVENYVSLIAPEYSDGRCSIRSPQAFPPPRGQRFCLALTRFPSSHRNLHR